MPGTEPSLRRATSIKLFALSETIKSTIRHGGAEHKGSGAGVVQAPTSKPLKASGTTEKKKKKGRKGGSSILGAVAAAAFSGSGGGCGGADGGGGGGGC